MGFQRVRHALVTEQQQMNKEINELKNKFMNSFLDEQKKWIKGVFLKT